jgi:hypothetical protein
MAQDAPFLADYRPKGSEKTSGRLATFQLHAGLDLLQKKKRTQSVVTILDEMHATVPKKKY